jgi:hypothetical protein
MRAYTNQFPAAYAPPVELLAALAAGGWEDESWGNDTCPRWRRDVRSIWCEHPDPERRECGGKRFTLTEDDGDGGLNVLGETDCVTRAIGWCRVRMLDLFAGLGGASAAMRDRGWDVVTVDADPAFGCTVTTDLTAWVYEGPPVDLVWASPPCEEFTRTILPWLAKTAPVPSMALVEASLRIVRQVRPRWWVLENVRGACRWFRPTLGAVRQTVGPYFLWGEFPAFGCRLTKRDKQGMSSSWRAERARIPYELSLALARSCESTLI